VIDWKPYMRTPYELGGRSFEGMDCYGLLHLVYQREYGITLEPFDDMYETTGEGASLVSLNLDPWHLVEPVDWKEGLGVMMWEGVKGLGQHVGVLAVEPWSVVTTFDNRGFQRFTWDDTPLGRFIKTRTLGMYEYVQC